MSTTEHVLTFAPLAEGERAVLFVDGQEVVTTLDEACEALSIDGSRLWKNVLAQFIVTCFSHQVSQCPGVSFDRGAMEEALIAERPDLFRQIKNYSANNWYWASFYIVLSREIFDPTGADPLAGRLERISAFVNDNIPARQLFVPKFVPGFLAECLHNENCTKDFIKKTFDARAAAFSSSNSSSSSSAVAPAELDVPTLTQGLTQQYQSLTKNAGKSPKDMLVTHINFCKDLVLEATTFYSLSCPIVQSSGSGKTRLALECREDFFLVYICFREVLNAIPARTPIAADLFMALRGTDNESTERAISVFFCVLFDCIVTDDVFVQNLHESARNRLGSTSTTIPDRKDWLHALRACFYDRVNVFSPESTPENPFWASVQRNYGEAARGNLANCTVKELSIMLSERMRNTLRRLEGLGENDTPQSSFLFVFDEVRYLFPQSTTKGTAMNPSLFTSLRSVSHTAAKECRVREWFFLFLETTSKATNFSPLRTAGSSTVGSDRLEGLDLLPTFYCFPFTGGWEVDGEVLSTKCADGIVTYPQIDGLTEFSYNVAEHILCQSRPMYLVQANRGNTTRVVRFAMRKFLGDSVHHKTRPVDELGAQMNALLCYCYGLKPTALELKEKLISDHAATLEVFESTRERFNMVVGYLPEPVLGEAAAWAIREDEEFSFSKRLESLLLAKSQGQLARAHSIGDRGEFAAMVYMLEMMRRTTEKAGVVFASSPVAIHELLSTMMNGADVKSVLAHLPQSTPEERARAYAWRHCLHALVNFTAVHEARSVLSEKNLKNAIASHVGWLAVPGEQGIDMVFGATRREDVAVKRNEAVEFSHVAKLFSLKAELWKCQDNISSLSEKIRKTRNPKKIDEFNKLMEESIDKENVLKKQVKNAENALNRPIPKKARVQFVLPLALALQVKNYSSNLSLSEIFEILRNQSRYVLSKSSCDFVVSIVIMVGEGSFSSAGIEVGNSCPSIVLLQCTNGHEQEDVGDVDLRSLYVVVNGFAGMTPEEQEKLKQFTKVEDPCVANKSKFFELLKIFSRHISISTGLGNATTQDGISSFFDQTAELQYKTEAPTLKTTKDNIRRHSGAGDGWEAVAFPTRGTNRGHFFVFE